MRSKNVAFALAILITGVFFVDWCAFVFQCGCRSLWSGLSAACNIHAAAGPHCPWCEHPLVGGGTAFAAAALSQWAIVYRASLGARLRFALALAAFPAASGLAALVQGVLWRYW